MDPNKYRRSPTSDDDGCVISIDNLFRVKRAKASGSRNNTNSVVPFSANTKSRELMEPVAPVKSVVCVSKATGSMLPVLVGVKSICSIGAVRNSTPERSVVEAVRCNKANKYFC